MTTVKLKKDDRFVVTIDIAGSAIKAGDIVFVHKGGANPIMARFDESSNKTVSYKKEATPRFMKYLRPATAADLKGEFADCVILKNDEHETHRGVSFHTVVGINNKPVFAIANTGVGGMTTVEMYDATKTTEIMEKFRKLLNDHLPSSKDDLDEFVYEGFVSFLMNDSKIMNIETYIKNRYA
jgi:hypothetical protein